MMASGPVPVFAFPTSFSVFRSNMVELLSRPLLVNPLPTSAGSAVHRQVVPAAVSSQSHFLYYVISGGFLRDACSEEDQGARHARQDCGTSLSSFACHKFPFWHQNRKLIDFNPLNEDFY